MLVQYHPEFWNYRGRSGEDLFPYFASHVRRPLIAIVHEAAAQKLTEPRVGLSPTRLAKWLNMRFVERLNHCTSNSTPGHALTRCDRVIVHCPSLRTWAIDAGVAPERIILIPLPMVTMSTPCVAPRFAGKINGIERRMIVVVGFPDRRKGFDIAIRSLPYLPADTVLVWAGSCRGGSDEVAARELHGLAGSLGVADRFIATGYLGESELNGWLQCATIGVAPFREATGSSSLSRLLTARLPIVASDLPAIRFLQECGAGVRCVESNDAPALARHIHDLLSDRLELDRLRERNAQFSRRFDFDSLATVLCEALTDQPLVKERVETCAASC